jgi:hypothetical protein
MDSNKKQKKKGGQQQQEGGGDPGHGDEPIVRLLALHGTKVAVAVGTSLRVLDSR